MSEDLVVAEKPGGDPELDQAVLQYLRDAGYQNAFDALQRDCHQPYEKYKHKSRYLERLQVLCRQGQQTDAQAMVDIDRQPWTGRGYAQKQVQSVEKLHSGENITAVRWIGNRILSGGADNCVYLCAPWGGTTATHRIRYDTGVVSIDTHEQSGLAVAGCMDGTVSLMRVTDDLTELQRWRLHKKYAHCVRWHPSGAWSAMLWLAGAQ